MKDIELMPVEDCKGKECYFCGSNDVQYTTITEDKELGNGELTRVYCCKKCVGEVNHNERRRKE